MEWRAFGSLMGQVLVVGVLLAALRRAAVHDQRWPGLLRVVLVVGALGLILAVGVPLLTEGTPREGASTFLSGVLAGVALTAATQPGIWREGNDREKPAE